MIPASGPTPVVRPRGGPLRRPGSSAPVGAAGYPCLTARARVPDVAETARSGVLGTRARDTISALFARPLGRDIRSGTTSSASSVRSGRSRRSRRSPGRRDQARRRDLRSIPPARTLSCEQVTDLRRILTHAILAPESGKAPDTEDLTFCSALTTGTAASSCWAVRLDRRAGARRGRPHDPASASASSPCRRGRRASGARRSGPRLRRRGRRREQARCRCRSSSRPSLPRPPAVINMPQLVGTCRGSSRLPGPAASWPAGTVTSSSTGWRRRRGLVPP